MNAPHIQKVINIGSFNELRVEDIPKLETCRPGMEPTEYNVLVALAVIPEKIGSIILSDESKESKELAVQMGRIVDASDIAFNYDQWPKNARGKPLVDDVVWFAKYAGVELTAFDGKKYRMVKDKDIGGVIERGALWHDRHRAE